MNPPIKIKARSNWSCPALEKYRNHVDNLHRSMGRLRDCTFVNFKQDRKVMAFNWGGQPINEETQIKALRRAYGICNEYCGYTEDANSEWLYLCGPCGSGKSHLAAAIANKESEVQIQAGIKGKCVSTEDYLKYEYYSVPDVLRSIRKGFGDHSAEKIVDNLCEVDFLVLDDMGAENGSGWAEEQLFTIINYRYLHNNSTVFTSNVRINVLESRIASRIAELAKEIIIPVSDYRPLKRLE